MLMERYATARQQRGGQEVGPGPAAPAPPGSGEVDEAAAAATADLLYKAMKGMGTDEDQIYKEAGKVKTQEQWSAVQRAFKKNHHDMKGGDLLAALKDELQGDEEVRVKDVMHKNGVNVWKPAGAAPASRSASVADSAPPPRTGSAAGPSPGDVSDKLYAAMSGAGTDEAAVLAQCAHVKDQEFWSEVQRDFSKNHSNFCGGNLIAALRDEHLASEEAKIREALAKNNVKAWEPAGPPGAAVPLSPASASPLPGGQPPSKPGSSAPPQRSASRASGASGPGEAAPPP